VRFWIEGRETDVRNRMLDEDKIFEKSKKNVREMMQVSLFRD
jgi:hypothetical protein